MFGTSQIRGCPGLLCSVPKGSPVEGLVANTTWIRGGLQGSGLIVTSPLSVDPTTGSPAGWTTGRWAGLEEVVPLTFRQGSTFSQPLPLLCSFRELGSFALRALPRRCLPNSQLAGTAPRKSPANTDTSEELL